MYIGVYCITGDAKGSNYFKIAQLIQVVDQLLSKSYRAQAIKEVRITKTNWKTRLLGIATVVDRWFQLAVLKSQEFINDGYHDVIDSDTIFSFPLFIGIPRG